MPHLAALTRLGRPAPPAGGGRSDAPDTPARFFAPFPLRGALSRP